MEEPLSPGTLAGATVWGGVSVAQRRPGAPLGARTLARQPLAPGQAGPPSARPGAGG